MTRWKIEPGNHRVDGRNVEKPLPQISERKAARAWAALGDAPRPSAAYEGEAARCLLAQILIGESRQQRMAYEAAAVICNRVIEERFPLLNFSEMTETPCGPDDYGHAWKRRRTNGQT
jgi:hypothetical protein